MVSVVTPQSLQRVWTAVACLLLSTAVYLLNIIHSNGILHVLYDKQPRPINPSDSLGIDC